LSRRGGGGAYFFHGDDEDAYFALSFIDIHSGPAAFFGVRVLDMEGADIGLGGDAYTRISGRRISSGIEFEDGLHTRTNAEAVFTHLGSELREFGPQLLFLSEAREGPESGSQAEEKKGMAAHRFYLEARLSCVQSILKQGPYFCSGGMRGAGREGGGGQWGQGRVFIGGSRQKEAGMGM